jgi:hypothetical protein
LFVDVIFVQKCCTLSQVLHNSQEVHSGKPHTVDAQQPSIAIEI